jgi:hypothetical protein
MRAAFLTFAFLIGAMGAAKADCLKDLGQLREQIDSHQARPTPQSQAAARELQKLEQNESANEIDCVNTLARARRILSSPVPPTSDDRYATDRQQQQPQHP